MSLSDIRFEYEKTMWHLANRGRNKGSYFIGTEVICLYDFKELEHISYWVGNNRPIYVNESFYNELIRDNYE